MQNPDDFAVQGFEVLDSFRSDGMGPTLAR